MVTHFCYAYNAQVAIVEVDETTGEVKVLKIISANDGGKGFELRCGCLPDSGRCDLRGHGRVRDTAFPERIRQVDAVLADEMLR